MVKKIVVGITLLSVITAGGYIAYKKFITKPPILPPVSYSTTVSEQELFIESDAAIQKLALPRNFSNNMVLQRDEPTLIWGTAKSQAEVTITFQSFTVTAKANEKGFWTALFPPQTAGVTGNLVVTSGLEQITLEKVLVGDVWMCAGQSNMVFSLNKSAESNKEALKSIEKNAIRFSHVPTRYNLVVESSIQTDRNSEVWFTADSPSINDFSALCALTAQQVYDATKIPQGMVLNAHNATNIESWMSPKQLSAFSEYNTAMTAIYSVEHLKAPIDYVRSCGQQLIPASHYNTMVFPNSNYTYKGIIWYQGESNAKRSENYQKLLTKLVSDWKKNPVTEAASRAFYLIELPRYDEPGNTFSWAAIRESQASVAAMIPQTFLVPASDLGEADNIHPVDKLVLSTRTAKRILANTYKTGADVLAPQVHSVSNGEKSLDVTLDLKGNTLEIAEQMTSGIEIAGSDEIYFMADVVKIKDNVLRVSSPYVASPKWIRVNWNNMVNSSITSKQYSLYIQAYTNNDKNKRSTVPLNSIICKE